MFGINPLNFMRKNLLIQSKSNIPELENLEKTQDIEKTSRWQNNGRTPVRNSPVWDLKKLPIKYYLNDGILDNPEKFNEAVILSFKSWSENSEGLISFSKTLNEEEADIIINWTNEKLPGRVFEAGRNDLKLINNRIEKAFITIIISPEIDKGLSMDGRAERVRRTSLHEIGHALGLNHSNNPQDIMFHRGINNKNLSHRDINRLLEQYKSKSIDFLT